MCLINIQHPIVIGIVAGEASGDILGAGLMRALKRHIKQVYFFGIGGPCMRSEHMEIWYNISELSVIGVFEIIYKVPRILNIRRKLIRQFISLKPDVFIGIDAPDFNLLLEKKLKQYGIQTVHYVSPTIWAWRKKRILLIKEAINKILVVLPFEKKIYDQYHIPCQFIGHTLADKIPLRPNKYVIRQKLGIHHSTNCLALLPGSRIKEINMLTRDFLICINLLNQYIPNLEVLVLLNNEESIKKFLYIMKTYAAIKVKLRIFLNHQGIEAWEVMAASDVSLLTSGTVTLECMLAKCPMVVAYRVHPITFILLKYLVKTPWISWPNLLSNRCLVKEFIQDNCQPKKIVNTLINLFNNNKQCIWLKREFHQLHYSIKCNADEQAAYAIIKLIKFLNT